MTRPTLALDHYADLERPQQDDELVTASIGPDGEAVALWASAQDVAAFGDARWDGLDRPVSIRATRHTPDLVHVASISNFRLAYPQVQPMPGGGFLLVAPRVYRRGDGAPPNAVIYDADGNQTAEGLLGDGIQHLQTTTSGAVWVGYFDEGVVGNLGWGQGPGTTPIGASGLVRFSPELEQDWNFFDLGLPYILDCYALNVTDETAWTCYYTDFPVVEVRSDAVRSWQNSVKGAQALAVHRGRIALYGGYGDDRDRLVIGRLDDSVLERDRECRLTLPNGDPVLGATAVLGRGSSVHVIVDRQWCRVDLADLSQL